MKHIGFSILAVLCLALLLGSAPSSAGDCEFVPAPPGTTVRIGYCYYELLGWWVCGSPGPHESPARTPVYGDNVACETGG